MLNHEYFAPPPTKITRYTVYTCSANNNCLYLSLTEELVSILHDLMGPADEAQLVGLHKLLNYVPTKGVGHTSVTLTPAKNVLWVAMRTLLSYEK